MTFADFIQRLHNAKKTGQNQYSAQCPAHNDDRNSLSISMDNERILLHCHAGCDNERILNILGLKIKDLFMQNTSARKIVAEYLFHDIQGQLVHKTIRYEPKGFVQARPDGKGGWIYDMKGVTPVLYNLAAVMQAIAKGEPVFVCEGEKDCDNLRQFGITATTNAMGAAKWRDSYSDYLTSADVVILPDNDAVGRTHTETVACSLSGKAKSIKILDLKALSPKLKEKGDISDILAEKGQDAISMLLKLVEETPQWTLLDTIPLLDRPITDFNAVFNEEFLTALAKARQLDPAHYARFKAQCRGKVNLNDLEKAVKHYSTRTVTRENFNNKLVLDGVDLPDFILPSGWEVSSENGVQKNNSEGTPITACFVPIVIRKRLRNVDSWAEKLELTFLRDGAWRNVVAPRSTVFSRNSIVRLTDNGLPVTSNSAGELINYLADFEQANSDNIPVAQSVSRFGWLPDGHFYPYIAKGDIEFEQEGRDGNKIIDGLAEVGDYERWLGAAREARKNPLARFILSASFASVLLELLHKRIFFVHLWHTSRSGKTAVLKLAIAAWGNPLKLSGSFNSTLVGLERMAATLRNLPFAIDELQVLNNKRLSPENVIYMLSQGQGRIRGGKDGGLQETLFWRNIILTTGEEALISGNTQDGAETRTIELYGQPVDNLADAGRIHEVAEQNYGWAGKAYMDNLISMIASKPDIIAADYKLIHDRLWVGISGSTHLDEVAAVALGDYYSSQFIFQESESEALKGSIQTALDSLENNRQLTQRDNVSRAWDVLVGWILSNESRFHSETSPPRYGRIDEKGNYLVIRAYADKAMEDAGFSPEKSFRGFLDRGWIKASTDPSGIKRLAVTKSIDGKSVRVYVVALPTVEEEFERLAPSQGLIPLPHDIEW